MLMQRATNTMVNLALLVVIPFAIYAFVQRRRHGRSMREICQRAGLQVGDLRYVGYCAAAVAAVGAAYFAWRPSLEVVTREGTVQAQFVGLGLGIEGIAAALMYGLVQTGFSEEFLFRGLIAGSLSRRMPPGRANILQAAIFLAPHLLLLFIMPEHWPMLILIFFGAMFAGWARIRSGSVLGPTLLHGGVNVMVTLYTLAN